MRKQAYLITLLLFISLILLSCKQARNDVLVTPMDAALYVKSQPLPESPDPVKAPETAQTHEQVQHPVTVKVAETVKPSQEMQNEEAAGSQADAADYFTLGLSLEDLGKFDEAAKAHKQAVLIQPDYAEAYYHLGLSLDNAGRYEEAVEAYQQVAKLKSEYTETLFKLGMSHENAGRYEEAVEIYRKVLSIKPDHTEAHYHLGYSSLMSDDSSSALEEYKTLQKMDPQMAVNLAKKAVEKAENDKNSKYILQLAAFKNINNANDLLKKIRPDYMHAYIERENNFSKVRINGIKTRDELDLVREDIIRKFKANPYTIELE